MRFYQRCKSFSPHLTGNCGYCADPSLNRNLSLLGRARCGAESARTLCRALTNQFIDQLTRNGSVRLIFASEVRGRMRATAAVFTVPIMAPGRIGRGPKGAAHCAWNGQSTSQYCRWHRACPRGKAAHLCPSRP